MTPRTHDIIRTLLIALFCGTGAVWFAVDTVRKLPLKCQGQTVVYPIDEDGQEVPPETRRQQLFERWLGQ